MQFFDNHCHLNDEKFDEDREKIINQLQENQISRCIVAGYDIASSKKAIEIAKNNQFIYTTCGISPNDITQEEEKMWKELDKIQKIVMENKDKVKAIGEIGLDYYWNQDNKKFQKEVFIRQINIANELDLPIVIHTREAIIDTIDILKNNEVYNKGVFHCCPQNRELIKEALKLGFYISFAGPITFKNSKNAEEIVKMVPNDRILIETDSPYLSPEPVRRTRNTPINVKHVANKIAQFKGLNVEQIANITFENANRIFKI